MDLVLPPERGAKYPSRAIHDYTCTMRCKKVSDKLKRHRQTFHFCRYDPERWEQERNATLSESLRKAEERASIAEGEAGRNKELLEQSQQQVGLVVVCEDELHTHRAGRLTRCERNWQHHTRSTQQRPTSSRPRARP